MYVYLFFFFKQKTAYEMRISDWSSDVCSSDLAGNKPFVLLLVIKLLQLTALAVTQAAMPFLFKQILHFTDTMLGLYFLVFYSSMMLSQQLWVRLGRKAGKRKIYLIASGVYALMYVSRSEEHTSELQSLMRKSYAVMCLQKKHIEENT